MKVINPERPAAIVHAVVAPAREPRMFRDRDLGFEGFLPSFSEFVQIYGLGPVVSPKRACEIGNFGPTKFYGLVKSGEFTLVHDGRSSKLPTKQLYDRIRRILRGDQTGSA
jgi:hypothetical protein